ncbi:MAG: beta-lactamase family protein [Gemmatimonadaceae bacterium]|nr:beta-lactamase family protein [Gemmatimonadaceae bacterium]
MSRAIVLAAVALACGIAAAPLAAQRIDRESVASRLRAYVEHSQIPGASLAIVDREGRVTSVTAGFADTTARRAMRSRDRLLMGSVGKTYVAAVALQLVRDGRLDLDARVASLLGGEGWFDSLPNASTMTLRQVMSHSSGLVRYEFQPTFLAALTGDPMRVWDPRDQLRFLHGRAAPFAAGAGWDYSDSNYLLVALAVERITGEPIDVTIQRRVLRPLRLRETMPSDSPRLAGVVQGYAGPDNPFGGSDVMLRNGSMVLNPQFEGAGGGYAATAADAARWGAAYFSGSYLGESSLRAATTGVAARQLGPGTRYGLGMILRDSSVAGPVRFHSGFFPGYQAELRHYPELGLTVALLINSSVVRPRPSLGLWVDSLAESLGRPVRAERLERSRERERRTGRRDTVAPPRPLRFVRLLRI